MKKQGKINTHCRDETGTVKNRDVPRTNSMHGRTANNKDEIDELIKRLVEEFPKKDSCDENMLIDLCDRYRKYQQGQNDAYEFLHFLESLFQTLVNDCDEIVVSFVTGCSIERKETDYERA